MALTFPGYAHKEQSLPLVWAQYGLFLPPGYLSKRKFHQKVKEVAELAENKKILSKHLDFYPDIRIKRTCEGEREPPRTQVLFLFTLLSR